MFGNSAHAGGSMASSQTIAVTVPAPVVHVHNYAPDVKGALARELASGSMDHHIVNAVMRKGFTPRR